MQAPVPSLSAREESVIAMQKGDEQDGFIMGFVENMQKYQGVSAVEMYKARIKQGLEHADNTYAIY